MALDDLAKDVQDGSDSGRDRWVAVYIGVLAVILAICAMGGGNATKDATLSNIEAANVWAFFQAKNMRRQVLRVQADDLALRLKTETDLTPDARAAIEAKIADYRNQDAILTTGDPDKPAAEREGLDQLFEKGKRLDAVRDTAMRRDPYFDYGEALLQIAIVLASISIITKGGLLLGVSGILGVAGALLTLNGFTLAFELPGIG
jgi:hypothetical protein